MKKLFIMVFSFILFGGLTYADEFCDALRYSELRAADGAFLGYLTNNPADTDSIACTYGDYGADYSLSSIFTPYGDYGASYQLNSPRCSYCLDAPYIFKGNGYWRLSLNPIVQGQLNTFEVLLCFISPFDERLKPYQKLDKDNILLYHQIESCQSEFGSNSTVGDERGKCKCMTGYKRDNYGTSCIPMSEDEKCVMDYGIYSYSPKAGYCGCLQGYEWDLTKTSCVKSFSNNTSSYLFTTGTESSSTVNCSVYGPNSISTNNGQCTCKENFERNYNKNWCVADRNNKMYGGKDFRSAKDGGEYINMLLDFEGEIEEKVNTENKTTANFEKTYNSKSDELKDAIKWMYDNGLTMFEEVNKFLPYNEITREQASKFFVEFAAKVLGKDKGHIYTYVIFKDIEQSDPTLKDYIIYSNNMGLFQGNNNYFMPHNNLTKAQAIAVLMRLIDGKLDESGTIPYYDVKGDFSEHYGWYMQYLGHTTFYKIDKWGITSNIDGLDSENISRGDLAILLYEMAMYLNNPDNIRRK